MFGNGKIFISHTHQDNPACDLLTAALDVWQIDYWMDLHQLSAGQELFAHIHRALVERDIVIRVCTPAAMQSPWMEQEETLARTLRAPNRSGKRLIINLIMAPGYRLTETQQHDTIIDATKSGSEPWIHQLRRVLGIAAPGRNLNRRAFVGLGITSVAALGAMGYVGKLLLTAPPAPGYSPQVHATPSTPQPAASRLLWKYAIGADPLDLQGIGLSVNESGVFGAAPFMAFSLGLSDAALRWQQFEVLIPGKTAPAIVGDTLYLLSDKDSPLVLLALNSQDGTERWHAVLDPNLGGNTAFYTAPVVTTGNTIIVQYNSTLAAFDATTHAALWPPQQHPFDSSVIANSMDSAFVAAPAVVGNILYAGMADGNLYAYNLTTGQLLWSFTQFAGSAAIQSTPTVANGVVYFGRNDGYCYAVNATNGALLWKKLLGSNITGVSAPTVAGGMVYLCAGSGTTLQETAPQTDFVYALDAQSGQIRWQAHPSQSAFGGGFPSYGIMNQPLLLNGTLYVTGSIAPAAWAKRDILYALNSGNGQVKWNYIVDGQGISSSLNNNAFPSPPVAYNDVVYFASSDATVYAMSAG